ncbi:MAG: U32 family peptidase [Bacilli bacterium]|nr:U32 family peptidase [Bacilli bacterium]
MKLVASIYNLKQLEAAKEYLDCAILMVPKYSLIYENDFDLDKAISICKSQDIEPILAINRIYLESELEEISIFINKYSSYKFYVHDLGVTNLFKEKNLINNVILDASTMVCNSMDAKLYTSFGFDAVSMSNEVPVCDVINAAKDASIFYQIFGRKLMFYSKRKLLSLYEKHSNTKYQRNDLSIKEEKREELMPIFENENGFYVYRSYFINLLNEIPNFSKLKYGFCEILTLKIDEIKEILRIYQNILNNCTSIEIGLSQIARLSLNIQDGFAYTDSIHKKEKIINE